MNRWILISDRDYISYRDGKEPAYIIRAWYKNNNRMASNSKHMMVMIDLNITNRALPDLYCTRENAVGLLKISSSGILV